MKHMMIKVLSLVMALTMIMGMFGAVAVSAAGHTHTKGEKVKTVAPTCVAYGYTLYECAGCGEQYADDVLPKTEECQNIEDVPAKEATCTTDATTAGKKCKDCGDVIEGCDPVPNTALGHSYDIMLIQPTCTEEGAVIEACTRCYDATKKWYEQAKDAVKDNKNLMVDDKTGVNQLPALNGTAHNFVYIITVAPTCTDAGKATYKCADCNEVTIENIYVAPSEALHNWVKVKDEATCLTPGLDGQECTECWAYKSNVDTNGDGLYDMKDIVPATNHKGTTRDIVEAVDLVWLIEKGFDMDDVVKAATCTEDGFKWVYCNACKDYIKLEFKAHGHTLPNMADEKLVKAVKEKVKAAVEGATVKVTDEKGNEYQFIVMSKANCAEGSVIACVDTLAPCFCEVTITLDDALSANKTHTWYTEPADKKSVKDQWEIHDPTCTLAGWTEVHCKNCDATKKVNVKPALGHDYKYAGDDCVTNGITITCSRCSYNAFVQYATHTTKVVKVEATCNEYAYDVNKCTVPGCKHTTIVDADKDGKKDYYVSEGFNPNNHSAKIKVEGAYYIPATCVTEGLATYACKNCAASAWTEVLPKITNPKHEWIAIEAVAPTCQATGVSAGKVCLTCAADAKLLAELIAREYKYNDGSVVLTGKDADGKTKSTDGKAYVWVEGGKTVAKDATKHVKTIEKFHRVGTCTMPELYLYECACGATWSQEGDKDAKNHNTYIYNGLNEVIGGTYIPASVVANVFTKPTTVGDEHWGALLTYVAGKGATCETAGNHNYVKCTGCSEVVEVSGYKIVFDDTDGTYTVDKNTWDCVICKNYYEDQVKANDNSDSTKATGVVPCPGFTLTFKNAGKSNWAVDKMSWTVDVAATGHNEKNVDAVQDTCTVDGYTAGKECTNAHCNLVPSKDGKRYVSGHVLLPKHDGRYDTDYNTENGAANGVDLSKPATCTEYGINAKVKYCKVCEGRITDVTKKAWYIKPEGHNLINVTGGAAATCDEIGFNVYRCSKNCSEGSVWTDLNANGTVDVISNRNSVKLADSEYTWFVTDYELATTHTWPKYDLEKETGYKTGVYYNGKIYTTAEFDAEFGTDAYKNNKCLLETIYYIECEKCKVRTAVADAIPATGHIRVDGEVKTPISTNCNEIANFYGFDCAACGLKIVDKDNTTHDLVVIVTPTTCSNPGKYYWACKDCDTAFYAENRTDAAPLYELYTPVAIDWEKPDDVKVVNKCATKFAKIDEYVKATATADGYFKYTCQTCLETVTVVLPAGEDVLFTINTSDVLGSKVTANGNQVVVSIAYTAKSYKFRTLNTVISFYNDYLAFDKAEVKATFAAELAVTTDVSVDEDRIDILTAVNVANGEAELAGENVAYVDLYFTVKFPYDAKVGQSNLDVEEVEALVYDEDGKLVVDKASFDTTFENDVKSVATGDLDADYDLDVTDLVALMDMIYAADAEYVAAADINKDGKIDIDDYAALRTFTASKQQADDYAAMMGVELAEVDYATMIVDALRVQKIDLNKDGIVNALDFAHLVANSNSYAADDLEALYDLDWTTASWEYYFFAAFEYTVEDITELVLEAYAAMI